MRGEAENSGKTNWSKFEVSRLIKVLRMNSSLLGIMYPSLGIVVSLKLKLKIYYNNKRGWLLLPYSNIQNIYGFILRNIACYSQQP
jgi:hypothetical protein